MGIPRQLFQLMITGRNASLAAVLACQLGCGGGDAPPSPSTDQEAGTASSGASSQTPVVGEPSTPATSAPVKDTTAAPVSKTVREDRSDPRYRVSFAEAAILDFVPDGAQLPPAVTPGGKSTAKLRVAIEREWDRIRVTDPNTGKPTSPHVVIDTEVGSIQVILDPETAPNHVRNFLALARVGYFEGLRFERIVRQQGDPENNIPALDLVTFGCPDGTGELEGGHIGYFMKPEFSEKVKHEAGTVGFYHGENPLVCGTRLYITLGTAPILDGQYTVIGKVTRGLDVVRTISNRPVIGSDPMSPLSEVPHQPVRIRGVEVPGSEKVYVNAMDEDDSK